MAGFLVVAWRGPDDFGRTNPAPTWFYVWFRVGLVPLSLLLGPIWKLISPLRTIAGLLGLLRRGPVGVADRLGYWPAILSLLAFLWLELLWLELLYDFAASPRMAHCS